MSNRPFPRVLQVLPALESGGVEGATLDMVAGIKKAHPTAETFVASNGGILTQKLLILGGQHLKVPLKSKTPWRLIQNAATLKGLIQKHGIQVVHARSRAPAWSALWAARQMGIPFITTYHGVYNSNGYLKTFYNSVMARGDRVIAISSYVADHIKKTYPGLSSKLITIPEGIDTDYFDPSHVSPESVDTLRQTWDIPKSHQVILLPGRLTHWKGQNVLIKALREMDTRGLTAIILGDDQGRTEYRKALEKAALGLPVKFIKNCHTMPAAYALADVVVSCSTDPEAFGRITAEALSMGRPYVGTNHGATPEKCIQGKTGFLVKPGNPKALAEILMSVLSLSQQEKDNLGRQGRAHICQNFSLKGMITRTLDLYAEVGSLVSF